MTSAAAKLPLPFNAAHPLCPFPILLLIIAFLLPPALANAQAEDLDAMSRDPGQWVMAPKNYANTRYSELDQINAENVGRLQLAWSFSVGRDRGQEAAPIVFGGTMYVVGPWPNNLFALDATASTSWCWSISRSTAQCARWRSVRAAPATCTSSTGRTES